MRIITGANRGKKLQAVPGKQTRPTADRAKEMLFNMLESFLRKTGHPWNRIIFADVFAGTGSIGLEAASRGAGIVAFIENNPAAVRVLRKNAAGLKNVYVFATDAHRPPKANYPVDILFLDPPYGANLWQEVLPILDARGWIGWSTLILVEVDKFEPTTSVPPGFQITQFRAAGRNTFLWITKIYVPKKR